MQRRSNARVFARRCTRIGSLSRCFRMEYIVSGRDPQFRDQNIFPDSCIQGERKREYPQEERAMPGDRRALWLVIGVLTTVAVPVWAASGGRAETVLLANQDSGDGNVYVDLVVRQVKVAPMRAYAGSVVHVDVVIENKGEGMATTSAELLVNGKVVARQLFSWGMSVGERLYRLSFDWDTRGIPPGEYRIGAQAFVWEDSSPFDNRLDVTQPLLIAPAGGGFPGGEGPGGSATETDPRFGKSRIGG